MAKKSLQVVIPVYNEDKDIENSVENLRHFLGEYMDKYRWQVVIANNASTDRTLDIAKKLRKKYKDVSYINLDQKGRGRALRKAWTETKADIVSYMDVDLSTDLEAFPVLIEALAYRGYDVATGSRLMSGSRTKRCVKREILSKGYNLIVKLILGTKITDVQCGFKAATGKAARELAPWVKDNNWFFDTELLIVAERKGYRIFETPVTWDEDLHSKVRIFKTVYDYLRDVSRIRYEMWFNREKYRKVK
ncbi:glycosyl transferase [Candidatus Woesearchaeota archaeon CG10_big_fil_rev_8_21_14_0_10_44_13]|nr:MAG: glycosyl transferase [Candidatus Woesearchaeota archaeon CG10_big_fil_rev_8_21_14_0_10_44_13]